MQQRQHNSHKQKSSLFLFFCCCSEKLTNPPMTSIMPGMRRFRFLTTTRRALVLLLVVTLGGSWWYDAAAATAEKLVDGFDDGFDKVTISHHGPVSWSLPLYLAEKFGYFEEMQIKPTFQVVRTLLLYEKKRDFCSRSQNNALALTFSPFHHSHQSILLVKVNLTM